MRFLMYLFFAILIVTPAYAWDFNKHSIPVDEIISGGPPKDGIPALMNPDYISVSKASYLRGNDQVIGVIVKGEARAYPLRIMSWHELVNDRIGEQPVLVSW